MQSYDATLATPRRRRALRGSRCTSRGSTATIRAARRSTRTRTTKTAAASRDYAVIPTRVPDHVGADTVHLLDQRRDQPDRPTWRLVPRDGREGSTSGPAHTGAPGHDRRRQRRRRRSWWSSGSGGACSGRCRSGCACPRVAPGRSNRGPSTPPSSRAPWFDDAGGRPRLGTGDRLGAVVDTRRSCAGGWRGPGRTTCFHVAPRRDRGERARAAGAGWDPGGGAAQGLPAAGRAAAG